MCKGSGTEPFGHYDHAVIIAHFALYVVYTDISICSM